MSCPSAFFWRPAAEPLAVRSFRALQGVAFPIQDFVTIRLQNLVVFLFSEERSFSSFFRIYMIVAGFAAVLRIFKTGLPWVVDLKGRAQVSCD